MHRHEQPLRRGAQAPRRGAPRGAPLDTITKFTSAPFRVDASSGEILQDYDPTLKWQLQAVARKALGRDHRINICVRHVRSDWREVQIRCAPGRRPYYAGVMVCGSVWVCPVCAAKIQAYRALEVRAAIEAWTFQGGAVVLLTQTVPHSRHDALAPLVERFTEALMKFKGCRAYTRASASYGISGSIRALEVTHGSNGWHPHAHSILFLDKPVPLTARLQADLFKLWESAARRAGFEGRLSPAAFKVQDAAAVRSYITKFGAEYNWNAEHELVRSHSKQGRGQSFTPFDFLRGIVYGEGSVHQLDLFREFARAFHGRRQLWWSRGLRDRLLGPAEELTDEAVAASIGELDPILVHLPHEEWQVIVAHSLQGQMLQVALLHGADGVRHLLSAYGKPVELARDDIIGQLNKAVKHFHQPGRHVQVVPSTDGLYTDDTGQHVQGLARAGP